MGENSGIQWCHHTFNPVRGCAKVSPACANCYAEALVVGRFGQKVWGLNANRAVASEAMWKQPRAWDKKAKAAGERHRVFCASLSDVFEDHPAWIEPRKRLFNLIEETPNLDWLLLTKRPENMSLFEPIRWCGKWPDNVWAGTTVESQEYADYRIPHLLKVPAAVRFLSVEPMLVPVSLDGVATHGIHWVIVGGESGNKARRTDPAWFNSLMQQCDDYMIPFFFKQTGVVLAKELGLEDKKGGELHELPPQWRVRQIPVGPLG